MDCRKQRNATVSELRVRSAQKVPAFSERPYARHICTELQLDHKAVSVRMGPALNR